MLNDRSDFQLRMVEKVWCPALSKHVTRQCDHNTATSLHSSSTPPSKISMNPIMATAAEPVTPCGVLPPPLYSQDPALYGQLIHFIQETFGLTEADRLVLLGVFKHIPVMQLSDSNFLVTRVLSLDHDHLKILAELFTAGLLDARSWGGLRKGGTRNSTPATTSATVSGQTTPAKPLMSPGYNELFHRLSVSSPFPTGPSGNVTTASDRAKRSAKLSRDCLKRQNNSCPLTTRTENSLETAHLIPHSVAAMSRQDTAFWLLLAIALGPTLRDHLFSVIHDVKSYSTMNGLVLDASMHRYFDAGIFVLLPAPDISFDPSSTDHLDVTFRWRSSPTNLKTCFTMLPSDPESQVSKTAEGKSFQTLASQVRQIEDGSVFRLFTDDPKRLPLPHPLLLSLHALLWRMIGSSGLAETTGHKRKRLASRPYKNLDTGRGDDDDDDDSNNNGGDKGKRVKRGRGHQSASGSGSARKGGNGDGGTSKDTGRDSEQVGGPSTDPTEHVTNDACPVVASPSPSTSKRIAPDHVSRPADQMSFLEKEYLAFQLRRLAAPVPSITDSDSDSDETDEEVDWASTHYGSTRVSQAPTFLEAEFARFHKRHPRVKARECSISGSESEFDSDYYYDSDSETGSEAESDPVVGGMEDGEVKPAGGIDVV